jgi:hypothetical protein
VTLLAGAYGRGGPLKDPDALLSALSGLLSRDARDRVDVVRDDRALLLKVDTGAFQVPGRLDDGTVATFVAGEPIIAPASGARAHRGDDVSALHRELRAGRYDILQRARGVFAVAQYDRGTQTLVIATDKLGVRPLYVWTTPDLVVFSSSLRLIENCTRLEKTIDLSGLGERLALSYPLGARTPYAEVTLLHAGEVVELAPSGVTHGLYWRWQEIARSDADEGSLTSRAYDAFMAGVRLRRGNDRTSTAFLSGGLDSRCVVAALRSEGMDLHTFNFSPPGSEDREYGAQLARAAGTTHEELEADAPLDPGWSAMIANAWQRSAAPLKARVERPQVMWSGDGGSVGLGHVYLRPPVVEQCVAGDPDGVVRAYLAGERGTVPAGLLAEAVKDEMTSAPARGVRAELTRLDTGELTQTFYLFLMQNDQRRHLHRHFEEIDQHRLELALPFYDADFLAIIASVPIEWRLYHAFYVKWLAHFPAYVLGTRWQAYPGHVPCPVPATRELGYQWAPEFTAAKRSAIRRSTLRKGVETLMAPRFAHALMQRRKLAMATLAHASGVRNYDYLLNAAAAIQRHWHFCDTSAQAHLTTVS